MVCFGSSWLGSRLTLIDFCHKELVQQLCTKCCFFLAYQAPKNNLYGNIQVMNLFDVFEKSTTALDDIITWKHLPLYWPFVRGIQRSPVNSPHKGQWRGALMFSLNSVWINSWVNNREAGNVRGHRTHYDVIAMLPKNSHGSSDICAMVFIYPFQIF